MGKVELKFEVDAELLAQARARGAEPAQLLEDALRVAAGRPVTQSWADIAREKVKDPEGAQRRAREWAEANRDAIAEYNARIEKHGVLSDYEPFRPNWMR